MAVQLLYCAGCNANFKAKSYDPSKAYPCPKCKQPLKLKGEADASASGVALDTQGKAPRADKGKDPLVGQKIAQYRIEKKLGQGGMGSVYKAKHLELGRSVALKILSPRLAEEEPDAVERFKREARAAAVLEHPNVVTTHAVGSEGNHHFIELQLVDGESLQARVVREKRLSLAEATRIVLDSSKALGAAHKQNIVHRDIKPGNIMLTKDGDSAGAAAGGREGGQVKVMDFGLAKDVTAPTQLTVSGHIMGTPHYMSPEQCDAKPLDGRSDIYALAATYFAILSGKTPYQGESLLSILQQQVTAPVPDVRKECPDLPEAVQHVLEKAMAKKPEDRFQTMEEFGAALAQVQSAGSGAAPAAATETMAAPVATEAETLAATLGDVMDADEERESHLHTARIRGRIKEVEAFLGAWKELAKAGAASRKKGQASEAEEAEFAKLRNTIHKQYAGILRRLGNPGAPGQRVVSACETGVTLSSIVQMADADFQNLSSHFQTGAKLLFDYIAFLEEGRQDLLKQSTFYFYWDKVMHNPMAAAIAGLAALMLLSIIGWQVVKRLPGGKLAPRKEVAQEAATTEEEAPDESVSPAKSAAAETPAVAAEPGPAEEADLMALEPAYPGFFPIGAWSMSFSRKETGTDLKGALDRLRADLRLAKSLGLNTATSHGLYGHDGKPYFAMVAKELGMHAICYNHELTNIYRSRKPIDADEVRKIVSEGARRLKGCPNLFEYWVLYDCPEQHFTPAMWRTLAQACTDVDALRLPQFVHWSAHRAAPYWKARPLPSMHSYAYPFNGKASPDQSIQSQIAHFESFVALAPNASYFPWLQAFGDGDKFRRPTATELRCISSLALAHGAKGLFYGGWRSHKDYDAIIDMEGEPTELGPEVKRVSQIIDRIGPVLLRLRLGPGLATAEGKALATTLVSKADHQYAFVVSLDLEKPAPVKVTVKPAAGKTLAGVRGVLAGKAVEAGGDAKLTFTTRLEPGEGRLFRILHRTGAPTAVATPDRKPSRGTLTPGKSIRNPTDGSEMVCVPAGTFKMGSDKIDNASPAHDVQMGAFHISKYEITNRQFKEFVDAKPEWGKGKVRSGLADGRYLEHWRNGICPADKADHPVVHISWFAAKAYCEWAGGRLPTEAEWEYACRAGSTGRYCFGEDALSLGEYAWFDSNSGNSTHPVGQKTANNWSLHDMHGNAWEWTSSTMGDYPYRAGDGREDAKDATSRRAIRGGSSYTGTTTCRSAHRSAFAPMMCPDRVSFRVCVSARESYTNEKGGSEMILLPGGTFKMGSTQKNEGPVHDVSVDSFYLSKYEITNRQFKRFVDANPEWQKGKPTVERANPNYLKHWPGGAYPAGQADHPVAWVSWFAAKAYCKWAGGRLPTEAEWEYACRAGSTGKFCFGDDRSRLKEYAWSEENSGGSAHPVGQKKANSWGLHDMHGNLWEWTSTIHRPYPYKADDGREDARDTSARSFRIMRGGSWESPGRRRCRSSNRTWSTLPGCLEGFGFRMAVSASEARKAEEAPAAPPVTDAAPAATGVRLPSVISDHMVLQRDMEVPIWGWASAGGKVTVSFAGQTKTATCSSATCGSAQASRTWSGP